MSVGVPWSPGFVSGLPPRGGFWNSPSDHETWSIGCHVGTHGYFTSILHSHTPWSLKRSVKWTWTGSAFSTNESAWSVVIPGSQSHVWSGPMYLNVSSSMDRISMKVKIKNVLNSKSTFVYPLDIKMSSIYTRMSTILVFVSTKLQPP